jgi:hypothetical protein
MSVGRALQAHLIHLSLDGDGARCDRAYGMPRRLLRMPWNARCAVRMSPIPALRWPHLGVRVKSQTRADIAARFGSTASQPGGRQPHEPRGRNRLPPSVRLRASASASTKIARSLEPLGLLVLDPFGSISPLPMLRRARMTSRSALCAIIPHGRGGPALRGYESRQLIGPDAGGQPPIVASCFL